LRACLLEPYRSHVIVAYIEDLISGLGANPRSVPEESALSEFRKKYFPSSATAGH